MSITQSSVLTASLQSADATTIGYRQVGDGPGVVLVHGGGQSSQNLMTLARALSDRFTVYVPDRRGRGMSGPHRDDHGIGTEAADLGALLDRFAGLSCEVLLLGGSKSARNLTAALDGLGAVLPRARRVTLPRAGHTAADNGGKPELVAAQLRAFFS